MNDPLLWTLKETAWQCGVSPRTIQRWVKCGALAAVRIHSRFIRIPSAAVRGLVARTSEVSSPLITPREHEPCAAQQIPPWEFRHAKGAMLSDAQRSAGCQLGKRTCKDMATCEEAKFYLTTCALGKLDKDGDGVPCEALCR